MASGIGPITLLACLLSSIAIVVTFHLASLAEWPCDLSILRGVIDAGWRKLAGLLAS